MKLTFNNRKAVVTGASRGIGKAIALMLAQAGVEVICVSKSQACQAVADSICEQGFKASAYTVDVSDPIKVQAATEELLNTYGLIDILVNNAGITKDKLLLRMSDTDWNDVLQTNLSSCFYWTRGLLQGMTRARWGRVLNVSSVVGLMGNPGQANYAAAKAGMIGFTKSTAKEVASRNVTANVITPGFITTDMTDAMGTETVAEAKKWVPLKRFGTPEEVASLVTFLASEEANYITGQTFSIDGGLLM